ncbi:MAG: thioredoxin fold domain-containing protein, partial [Gammaproteobacteria bacterium]
MNRVAAPLTLLALLAWLAAGTALAADDPDAAFEFDDFPLENLLQYPTWFKKSFLDLREDLEDAKAENKQGIIVYFGQRRCAYCKMLMEVNFKLTDIVTYTRRHFDVIPIDIWSPEEMTDPAGNEMSQRQFAVRMGTNFTPSLLFYDTEGRLA